MAAPTCRPAEAVTAQSQIQGIGSPGVVQLASEFRDVPGKTAGAALRHRLCAPVGLTRVLHALLELICSRKKEDKQRKDKVSEEPLVRPSVRLDFVVWFC